MIESIPSSPVFLSAEQQQNITSRQKYADILQRGGALYDQKEQLRITPAQYDSMKATAEYALKAAKREAFLDNTPQGQQIKERMATVNNVRRRIGVEYLEHATVMSNDPAEVPGMRAVDYTFLDTNTTWQFDPQKAQADRQYAVSIYNQLDGWSADLLNVTDYMVANPDAQLDSPTNTSEN